MADLSTNYMDDILAESMNGKRKYRITRADGSFEEVTLEDISEYEQIGSVFGAGDINRTNQAVNEKFDSGDVVDPMETTVPGFAADALAVKNQFNEQNKNFATPTLLATITPETDGQWKTISAISDWKEYDELVFIGNGSWGESSDDENANGFYLTVKTAIIPTNFILTCMPYLGISSSHPNSELKIKFPSTKKLQYMSYTSSGGTMDNLKIYGKKV